MRKLIREREKENVAREITYKIITSFHFRVSRNQSLFEVVPDPVNSTKQYCSCLENSGGNSTLSCSARPNVQMSNIAVRRAYLNKNLKHMIYF